MYITDDGVTRLYLNIPSKSHTLTLTFTQSVAKGISVNWGDNSTSETFANTNVTATHTYKSAGEYIILLTVNSGTLSFSSSLDANDLSISQVLEKVELGKNVTTLNGNVFSQCYRLTNVTIPSNVVITGDTFSNCSSLKYITIPTSTTLISEQAFYQCHCLQNISIPNSITSIEKEAFNRCYSLTSITIGDKIGTVGEIAFNECKSLQYINIPFGIKTISNQMLYNCAAIQNITIPNSVTAIGGHAFEYCSSLQNITIPDSVTVVGQGAFYKCTALKNVSIPNVTITELAALRACNSLVSVVLSNNGYVIYYKEFKKYREYFYKHFLIDSFSETMINVQDLVLRKGVANYKPIYEYTIQLFSETKGLEVVQLPNISITEPLNLEKKISVWEYLNKFVDMYSPKFKQVSNNQKKTWEYTQKYHVDSDLKPIFENVYSPDFSLNNPIAKKLESMLCEIIP